MAATVAETILYNEDSATPLTVSKPGSFASGQILVAIIHQHGASGHVTDLTAPSGWTQVGGDLAGTDSQGRVFYHVFNGSEPSTWDFPYYSSADVCLALFRITGADTTPTIVVQSANSASVGSSFDSPTITPSGSNDLLIVTIGDICDGNTFSATVPSGTTATSPSKTQVAGGFMALAAATQALASSSATGAKTWTSVTPSGHAGGSFSVTVKSTSSSGTAETGLGAVGLSGSSVAVKVAPQTSRATLGLSARATAVRVAIQTSRATLGLSGRASQVKRATPVTAVSVGLSGSATEVKRATPVATVSVGLTGVSTAKKVTAETGRSVVGFTPYGPTASGRPQSGRCIVGLTGSASASHIAGGAGQSLLALSGKGTASKKMAHASSVVVGLGGVSTVTKKASSTGLGQVGFTGRGVAVKKIAHTGTTFICVVGRGASVKKASSAGRCVLGLSGYRAAINGVRANQFVPFFFM